MKNKFAEVAWQVLIALPENQPIILAKESPIVERAVKIASHSDEKPLSIVGRNYIKWYLLQMGLIRQTRPRCNEVILSEKGLKILDDILRNEMAVKKEFVEKISSIGKSAREKSKNASHANKKDCKTLQNNKSTTNNIAKQNDNTIEISKNGTTVTMQMNEQTQELIKTLFGIKQTE